MLRRDRLGFVFQAFNLLPTLTAQENIALPADLAGRAARPGLVRHRGRRPLGLRRPARAPPLRALRRPAAAGRRGPGAGLPARGRLRRRAHRRPRLPGQHRAARASCGPSVDDLGQTVVMVTHDPGAAAYADRVVFLVDGRIVEELARPDPRPRARDHGAAGGLTAMLKVSLRNLLANKLRLFLTVAAVTVGVAFVSGTFVLSDTMAKAFDQLYAGLTSGTDVVVRAASRLRPGRRPPGRRPRPLDESLVADSRAGARGGRRRRAAVAGFALILDKHGKPIQPGGAPTLGSSVGDDRRLAGADFSYPGGPRPGGTGRGRDRRRHGAEGRVTRSATRVDIVFQDGRRTFTVVGVVGFGETDSLAGATLAGFDLPTAQHVLGKVGRGRRGRRPGRDGHRPPTQLRDCDRSRRCPHGVEALTGTAGGRRGLGRGARRDGHLHQGAAGLRRRSRSWSGPSSSGTPSTCWSPSADARWRCCARSAPPGARCSPASLIEAASDRAGVRRRSACSPGVGLAVGHPRRC